MTFKVCNKCKQEVISNGKIETKDNAEQVYNILKSLKLDVKIVDCKDCNKCKESL